jgi:hypothetical protein
MLGVLGDWIANMAGYTTAMLGNLRVRLCFAPTEWWVGARMEQHADRVYCWVGGPLLHLLATWDSDLSHDDELVRVYNQHGKRKAVLRMNQHLYDGLMRGTLCMPDTTLTLPVQTHSYLGPPLGWYVRVYERGAQPVETGPPGWDSWEKFYEQFQQ